MRLPGDDFNRMSIKKASFSSRKILSLTAMKSVIPIVLFALFSVMSMAQNLIPNPGFEDNAGLPFTTGQWSLVDHWDNAGSSSSSPDYFHGQGSLGGDLPETPIGEVYAFEGDAVMGFAATGEKGTNFREYLSIELSQALEPGKAYEVSFRITNGSVSQFSNAGLSSSHLGIHLSSTPPSQIGNNPLMLTPDGRYGNTVYNTAWQLLRFYVEADEADRFLTIGVFGADDDKDILDQTGRGGSLAYYFVDDFKLVEVEPEPILAEEVEIRDEKDIEPENPLTEELESLEDFYIPNAFSPDNDGINDLFVPCSKKGFPYTMRIFNKWGELVYEMNESSPGWDGSNVKRDRTSEVYVWQLIYEKLDEDKERVEKIVEGSLTVVR